MAARMFCGVVNLDGGGRAETLSVLGGASLHTDGDLGNGAVRVVPLQNRYLTLTTLRLDRTSPLRGAAQTQSDCPDQKSTVFKFSWFKFARVLIR